MPQDKIYSIILASNKPDKFSGFMENLEKTCASPRSFEVLVKVDEEDTATVERVKEEARKRPFEIKPLISPREGGYFTLHHAYQKLFMEFSDPGTYYASVLTDEIRFDCQGWDELLASYIGRFPDDVFRLRISENRNRNYYSVRECLSSPENYSVATRRWYELTEGMGDVFWGVDSWHQCIEYYLGQLQTPKEWQGVFRGLPVDGIRIVGTEAGEGWAGEAMEYRRIMVEKGWQACQTYEAHQKMLRHATRLAFHVYLNEKGWGHYDVREDSTMNSWLAYPGSGPEYVTPLASCQYYLPQGAYLREKMPRLLDVYRTNPGQLVPETRAWPPLKESEQLERYFNGPLWGVENIENGLAGETDKITVALTAANLNNLLREFCRYTRMLMSENILVATDEKKDFRRKFVRAEMTAANFEMLESALYDALDGFSLDDVDMLSFYRHMSAVRTYMRNPNDPNKCYAVQGTLNWLSGLLARRQTA